MTQPEYVPLQSPDRVRPSDSLSTPLPWTADRPAELAELRQPAGARFGATGPDLGYGLKLAKRFEHRIALRDNEDHHDAVAAAFACGAKRAAGYGRAPVIYDMEWAYTLLGYVGSPAEGLVTWRARAVRGAGHDYERVRTVVDAVAPEAFRLSLDDTAATAAGGGWQQLWPGAA